MPHFVIDCSENVLTLTPPETLIGAVYAAAESTGLFAEGDIKVRINPFQHFTVGGKKGNFVHVFAHIMEGRSTAQKSALSRQIVGRLKQMLPDVPVLSMNVVDFEKATYCNKSMV